MFGKLHFVHKPQLMALRKPSTSLLILAWNFPLKVHAICFQRQSGTRTREGQEEQELFVFIFLDVSVAASSNRGRIGALMYSWVNEPIAFPLCQLPSASRGLQCHFHSLLCVEGCLQKSVRFSILWMYSRLTISFPVSLFKTHHWKCFFPRYSWK